MKTFSNMSYPDRIISIQAYVYYKKRLEDQLLRFNNLSMDVSEKPKSSFNEKESVESKLKRVNDLIEALESQCELDENQ